MKIINKLFMLFVIAAILSSCSSLPDTKTSPNLGEKTQTAIRAKFAETLTESDKNLAKIFIDIFENALLQRNIFILHERKDIAILGEERADQEKGILSKEVESEYLSKGVKYLTYAIFKKIDNRFTIQIKLTYLETGEILASTMEITQTDSDSIKATAEKMAKSISVALSN